MSLQVGYTPLTCAVMYGHANVIHYLTEAKADRSKVPQVTFLQTVMTIRINNSIVL